jgi:hypothetical protein
MLVFCHFTIVPAKRDFAKLDSSPLSNTQYGEQDLTGLSDSDSISVILRYMKRKCSAVGTQNLSGLFVHLGPHHLHPARARLTPDSSALHRG